MSNVIKFQPAATGRAFSTLVNVSNMPRPAPQRSIQDTFDALDLRWDNAQATFNACAGQGPRAKWATGEMLLVAAERRAAWARLDQYIGRTVPDDAEPTADQLTDAELDEIEAAAIRDQQDRDAERHDGEIRDWLYWEADDRDHDRFACHD